MAVEVRATLRRRSRLGRSAKQGVPAGPPPILLDLRRIREQAQFLLERVDRGGETLSILLTDDRQMAALHKRWMGEEGSTDVLSFPYSEAVRLRTEAVRLRDTLLRRVSRFGPPPSRVSRSGPPPVILGDIVISAETAARRGRGRADREVLRCLVHGILHLIGHDHRTGAQRIRMSRLARRLARELYRAPMAVSGTPYRMRKCSP